MQFAHILTSIPVGSRVYVYARGRFVQFDETMKSSAIGIVGDPQCYPIKVKVTPSTYGHAYRGGFKVVKPMGSEWEIDDGVRGGSFDIVINDVMQFNPGKIALFNKFDPRVGPYVTVHQVNAPANPVTDVFNIWKCEGCGVEVQKDHKFCEACAVVDTLCPHLRLGAPSPTVCGNPMVEGYGACQQHLDYMGIEVKKKLRVKKREVVKQDRLPGAGADKIVNIVVDDGITGESKTIQAVETKVVIPAKPRGKRGPYKHSAAYYEKRGMPVPVEA